MEANTVDRVELIKQLRKILAAEQTVSDQFTALYIAFPGASFGGGPIWREQTNEDIQAAIARLLAWKLKK